MELTTQFMKELKEELIERTMSYPLNRQFSPRLIKPDTWAILPYNPSPDTPSIHLVIGEERALVIDPTDTPYDVRAYIRENLTDKPLVVANTHSHGDHTYANYLFDDCTIYMSEKCQAALRRQRENPGMRSRSRLLTHQSQNEGTVVKPGDVIDLGGREIEILGCEPCHDESSILYWDKTCGILFTGDEIDPGQCNLWNAPLEVFYDNIKNLIALRDGDPGFDMVCAPHNGTPMNARILDYYKENCERVFSGIEGDIDKGSVSYLLNPFEPRGP